MNNHGLFFDLGYLHTCGYVQNAVNVTTEQLALLLGGEWPCPLCGEFSTAAGWQAGAVRGEEFKPKDLHEQKEGG